MDFPICGAHINPVWLILLGFVIGIFGGFFGVGGSFLAGPALYALGVPMNFVVGTDLIHIVGKSIVATRQHHGLGNIDYKLAGIMVLGTIAGSETGVQFIQALKRHAHVDIVVGGTTIVLLLFTAIFMAHESLTTLRAQKKRTVKPGSDRTSFDALSKLLQKIQLRPMIKLPQSGIRSVSLWIIIAIGYVGGFFSGFLGGGAGYIRMPALVYILGVPTHIAVGTDLFEIIVSAAYGSFRHAISGNVDILVALVMNTGAAVGAQMGARFTQYFSGPKIRLAFAPLPLIGVFLVLYGLIKGHHI